MLGSSVGQTIVRIEIEAAKAAELNPQPLPPGFGTQGLQTLAAADILHTIPYADTVHTSPYADTVHTSPYADIVHTIPYADIVHTIPYFDQGGTSVYADQGGTSVYADQGGTSVYADQGGTSVYADQGGTSVYADQVGTGFADQIGPNTLAEGIPDPYGGYGQGQFGGVSPFALATPHQASGATLAQLQLPYGGNTIYWRDHKLPSQDKRPQEDGTFPGHPHSDF